MITRSRQPVWDRSQYQRKKHAVIRSSLDWKASESQRSFVEQSNPIVLFLLERESTISVLYPLLVFSCIGVRYPAMLLPEVVALLSTAQSMAVPTQLLGDNSGQPGQLTGNALEAASLGAGNMIRTEPISPVQPKALAKAFRYFLVLLKNSFTVMQESQHLHLAPLGVWTCAAKLERDVFISQGLFWWLILRYNTLSNQTWIRYVPMCAHYNNKFCAIKCGLNDSSHKLLTWESSVPSASRLLGKHDNGAFQEVVISILRFPLQQRFSPLTRHNAYYRAPKTVLDFFKPKSGSSTISSLKRGFPSELKPKFEENSVKNEISPDTIIKLDSDEEGPSEKRMRTSPIQVPNGGTGQSNGFHAQNGKESIDLSWDVISFSPHPKDRVTFPYLNTSQNCICLLLRASFDPKPCDFWVRSLDF